MDLVRAWDGFAKLRKCGWGWHGSDYPNARRGSRVDEPGLVHHEIPLRELLKVAPTGFPAQSKLRMALEYLQLKHNIFGDLGAASLYQVASEAADRWRIMAKDVHGCAVNGYKTDALVLEVVVFVGLRP